MVYINETLSFIAIIISVVAIYISTKQNNKYYYCNHALNEYAEAVKRFFTYMVHKDKSTQKIFDDNLMPSLIAFQIYGDEEEKKLTKIILDTEDFRDIANLSSYLVDKQGNYSQYLWKETPFQILLNRIRSIFKL